MPTVAKSKTAKKTASTHRGKSAGRPRRTPAPAAAYVPGPGKPYWHEPLALYLIRGVAGVLARLCQRTGGQHPHSCRCGFCQDDLTVEVIDDLPFLAWEVERGFGFIDGHLGDHRLPDGTPVADALQALADYARRIG